MTTAPSAAQPAAATSAGASDPLTPGAPAAAGATTPRAGRVTTFHWALLALAVVGFVFRAGYVVETRTDDSLCGSVLCGDALYYSGQANVIGLGHGYLDPRDWKQQAADHPPLTALLLAPVTVIGGDNARLATEQRLVMALFGAAVIFAIGLLGRRVGGPRGPTVGLIAAGIAAVNANFWMNDVVVMSETIATLGIVVTLLACYRFIATPTWRWALTIGALVALTALARAELLLLAPVTFVPLALWARSLSWSARVARIGIATLAALVVLAPWTIYNMSRFEEPVLLSTNDGLTLVGANCDAVYGIPEKGGMGFWNLGCALDVSAQIPPDADQSVASGVYRKIGLDYIKAHAGHLPEVETIRTARAWGFFAPDQMVWLNTGEGRTNWASWLGYIQWWLLLVPAAAGLVLLRKRRVAVWPLASTAIIVTLTAMAFYGIVRFRIAADVAVTVLAAVALDALWHRLRAGRDQPATIDLDAPIPPAA